MNKLKMPVEKMVAIIAEGCADYTDGDDPGYFNIKFDPSKVELIVSYAPDEAMNGAEFEAQFAATEHRFTLVSTGLGWPEGGAR
jgi:hypothetical protein